jgi:hypothetical protein
MDRPRTNQEKKMPAEAAGERIVRNLQDAIERLQDDVERVELWAGALNCFARPVPEYDPTQSNLHKFALPAQSADASHEVQSAGASGEGLAGTSEAGRKNASIKGSSKN